MPISHNDLEQLQKEPSPKARAQVARKIASDYAARLYTRPEEEIALEIFRLLTRDAEIKVRAELSIQLRDSIDLPRDIALRLAHDVEVVAIPFLEASCVLSEDDLIEVAVSTKKVAILNAIARRESVSQELSAALLFKGDESVISTLAANLNASIHEDDILELLRNPIITKNDTVLESLVERGGLSLRVTEKLFSVVSDSLKQQLTEKYHLLSHIAEDSVRSARELAMLGITSGSGRGADIEKLVDQLYAKKRLTFSIIVRALCQGDLRFFEASMAKLAGVPTINARILILDPGPLGFKSLYQTTPMPAGFLAALKLVLTIVLQETDYGRISKHNIKQRIVERIMDSGATESVDNLDYMVALIGRTDRHDATVH
jgi:uncharacterized protein (DUF2336 family)